MDPDIVYRWERLPEYVATQQYGRCLGRIFRSLPWGLRRRLTRRMTGAAMLIAQGIAGFNAELPPDETMSDGEREAFRAQALAGLRASREALDLLGRAPRVSRPDLFVAGELLERIESSVRAARLPPGCR